VCYSLLLVENETSEYESLQKTLADCGYTVRVVHTNQEINTALATRWPDVIIFNFAQGLLNPAVLRQALAETQLDIPCLAVVDNNIVPPNLKVDLLVHTLSENELAEQIPEIINHERFVRFGEFVLDTHKKTMRRANTIHPLTPKLFQLLVLLLKNQGQIVYRKTIMQEVWDTDYMGDTRTLDVHVRWLREKIEDNPSRPRHLLTVRGAGYRFIVNPDDN